MSFIDLTTVTRVKQLLSMDTALTKHDAILNQLVDSVSGRVQSFLGLHTQSAVRTEVLDVEFDGQKRFHIPTYPITAFTSLNYDPDGDFDSSTLVSSSDYRVNLARGIIVVELTFSEAYQALQIVYEGGMAADTTAFVSAYPDIAGAVDQQIAYEFQRRSDLGMNAVSGQGGTVTQYPIKEFLPSVRAILSRYRRSEVA